MDFKFLFSLFPFERKISIYIDFFIDAQKLGSKHYLITHNDKKKKACTDVLYSFEEEEFDQIEFHENSSFSFALYYCSDIFEKKRDYIRKFDFSAREVRYAKNKGEYKKSFRFRLGDARFESEVLNLRERLHVVRDLPLLYNDIGVVLSFREGVMTFIPQDGTDDIIDFSIENQWEILFKKEISSFKEFLPKGYMKFGFVCGQEQRPFYHFIPRTILDDFKSTDKNVFLTNTLFETCHAKSKKLSFCERFLQRIVTVDIVSGLFFTPWKINYTPQQVVTEPTWLEENFVPGDLDRTMLRLGYKYFQSTKNVLYGIAVFSKGNSFRVGLCSLQLLNREFLYHLIDTGQTQLWGETRRHTGGFNITLTKNSLHLICEEGTQNEMDHHNDDDDDAIHLFSFFFYYKNRDHALFFSRGVKYYLSLKKKIFFTRLPRYQIYSLADQVTETTVRIFNSSVSYCIRDAPFMEMIFYNPLQKGHHFLLNIEIINLFLSNYVFEVIRYQRQQKQQHQWQQQQQQQQSEPLQMFIQTIPSLQRKKVLYR